MVVNNAAVDQRESVAAAKPEKKEVRVLSVARQLSLRLFYRSLVQCRRKEREERGERRTKRNAEEKKKKKSRMRG